MNWTRGIYEILTGDATVSSVVSTRVYPLVAPEGTAMPFVTYEVTGSTIMHTKEKAEAQLAQIELVAYAAEYGDAVTVGGAVRNALKRESYELGAISIDKIFIDDESLERLEDPERYAFVLQVQAFVPYK